MLVLQIRKCNLIIQTNSTKLQYWLFYTKQIHLNPHEFLVEVSPMCVCFCLLFSFRTRDCSAAGREFVATGRLQLNWLGRQVTFWAGTLANVSFGLQELFRSQWLRVDSKQKDVSCLWLANYARDLLISLKVSSPRLRLTKASNSFSLCWWWNFGIVVYQWTISSADCHIVMQL